MVKKLVGKCSLRNSLKIRDDEFVVYCYSKECFEGYFIVTSIKHARAKIKEYNGLKDEKIVSFKAGMPEVKYKVM